MQRNILKCVRKKRIRIRLWIWPVYCSVALSLTTDWGRGRIVKEGNGRNRWRHA